MELLCIETYHDIRFTLNIGDSTKNISFLTEEEVAALLADYPWKFRVVETRMEKSPELELTSKEAKLSKKITKK